VLEYAKRASQKYSLMIQHQTKPKYISPEQCYNSLKVSKLREVLLVRVLEQSDKGAQFDRVPGDQHKRRKVNNSRVAVMDPNESEDPRVSENPRRPRGSEDPTVINNSRPKKVPKSVKWRKPDLGRIEDEETL
jgi:hypothetical protein